MTPHPLWSHSLLERVAMLRPATKRIAYLSERPEPGTFRYRCFNPVDAIGRAHGELSAAYFFLSDFEVIDNLSDLADALVVSRVPYDVVVDRAFRAFHQSGKPVYFDIDDLVVDPRYASLVASNLSYRLVGKELNSWTAFTGNIGLALAAADGVTTTTPFLAERIRESFPDASVTVVPNSLNHAQLEVSERAYRERTSSGAGLALGYFSGSPSHAHDFAVAGEGIVSFLKDSPSSTLTVVGFLELPASFRDVEGQVRRLAYMDFLELQGALSRVDLNLAPLQASAFTHSKSELKYFEAAAVGTPTLASRAPVFESAIDHGRTGFLADNALWLDRLREIEALGPEARSAVGEAARRDALGRWGPESMLARLSELFRSTN